MDYYTQLLFAVEVRKLAFDLMHADHPELSSQSASSDLFPQYLDAALREVAATAKTIHLKLQSEI